MRAEIRAWLPGPLDRAMERAIERLAHTEGVVHVALMPDAHLAEHVCVGTVVATHDRLLPDAVGGDIGCGMCAFALDASADRIGGRHPRVHGKRELPRGGARPRRRARLVLARRRSRDEPR